MSTAENIRLVNVDLKIKSVTLNKLKERIEVIALWQRNGKTTDTIKVGKLGPTKPNTRFGEAF
jgi:hypothetical protein